MGGRGINASDKKTQISIDYLIKMREIEDVYETYRLARKMQTMESIQKSNLRTNDTMKKQCSCCKEWSLLAYTCYTTCPVCGWIDDPMQNRDPYMSEGKNPTSLNEAQLIWFKNQVTG